MTSRFGIKTFWRRLVLQTCHLNIPKATGCTKNTARRNLLRGVNLLRVVIRYHDDLGFTNLFPWQQGRKRSQVVGIVKVLRRSNSLYFASP